MSGRAGGPDRPGRALRLRLPGSLRAHRRTRAVCVRDERRCGQHPDPAPPARRHLDHRRRCTGCAPGLGRTGRDLGALGDRAWRSVHHVLHGSRGIRRTPVHLGRGRHQSGGALPRRDRGTTRVRRDGRDRPRGGGGPRRSPGAALEARAPGDDHRAPARSRRPDLRGQPDGAPRRFATMAGRERRGTVHAHRTGRGLALLLARTTGTVPSTRPASCTARRSWARAIPGPRLRCCPPTTRSRVPGVARCSRSLRASSDSRSTRTKPPTWGIPRVACCSSRRSTSRRAVRCWWNECGCRPDLGPAPRVSRSSD